MCPKTKSDTHSHTHIHTQFIYYAVDVATLTRFQLCKSKGIWMEIIKDCAKKNEYIKRTERKVEVESVYERVKECIFPFAVYAMCAGYVYVPPLHLLSIPWSISSLYQNMSLMRKWKHYGRKKNSYALINAHINIHIAAGEWAHEFKISYHKLWRSKNRDQNIQQIL